LILFFILLGFAFLFIIIAQVKNAEVVISPIVGFMLGVLYHKERYDVEDEFTLQCLLGVISINVIWVRAHNG